MLDLWLKAEAPGVTHFGAYHRPPDGHFCFIYIWPTKGEQSYHLFFVANDDIDIEDNDADAGETGSEEQQQGRRGSYGWWPEQGFCYFFY